LLAREGFEDFEMSVVIEFRPIYQLENQEFEYKLKFDKSNSMVHRCIEVDT